MSISRKNWSALSTLTRQWTVEDEEEVEREKRRKTREPSTSVDAEESPSEEIKPQTSSVSGTADDDDSSGDTGGGVAQLQMDFVEMLRVRDERRRMRHVETLMKNKEVEEPHVELLGEKQDELIMESVQRCVEAFISSEPSTNSTTSQEMEKQETESTKKDSTLATPAKSSRKFVSSFSISFDKSPSSPPATSRLVSPLSPRSPPHYASGAESPHSPAHSGTVSPTPNGDAVTSENGSASNFEPAAKPAFTRQSSRTTSFRMMKKKEEAGMPLQRSASVRIAPKTPEPNKSPNQQDEQQSPFQRNSRQRISSRSIQEKMERLAQASQKWEITKSPTIHNTVCLSDEVSRKRGMFEKEKEEVQSFLSKQDFRSFSSGISDRINRCFQKNTFTLSSPIPTDLRHVNISSKKSLFERKEEDHK